jgi:type II secretory pathway pseudopilin PulG
MRRQELPLPSLLGSAGYSLVEVVVAMLIACVMVTAVMGVAVTSKQGSAKNMHRMMFDQGIAQLSSEVKQYVTACGCRADTGVCPAPSCADPGILGPNTAGGITGVNQWYLAGAEGTFVDAATAPPPAGAPRSIWALACGDHYITGVVPSLEAPPYNGYIMYSVGWPTIGACTVGLPGINDAPTITFTANWTEP